MTENRVLPAPWVNEVGLLLHEFQDSKSCVDKEDHINAMRYEYLVKDYLEDYLEHPPLIDLRIGDHHYLYSAAGRVEIPLEYHRPDIPELNYDVKIGRSLRESEVAHVDGIIRVLPLHSRHYWKGELIFATRKTIQRYAQWEPDVFGNPWEFTRTNCIPWEPF